MKKIILITSGLLLVFIIIVLSAIMFSKPSKYVNGSVPFLDNSIGFWEKSCLGLKIKSRDLLIGGGATEYCLGFVGEKICYGIEKDKNEISEMSCDYDVEK